MGFSKLHELNAELDGSECIHVLKIGLIFLLKGDVLVSRMFRFSGFEPAFGSTEKSDNIFDAQIHDASAVDRL